MRVLIADDHDMIRHGLRTLIESKGWTVCAEARNGREAMELADKHKPDIAILDVSMPELNGVDTARHILQGAAAQKCCSYPCITLMTY